jgi:hypothetical protein
MTFVVLDSFGNTGLNVAVPAAFVHAVPPTAPAGAAVNAAGTAIAAVNNNTPVILLRMNLP